MAVSSVEELDRLAASFEPKVQEILMNAFGNVDVPVTAVARALSVGDVAGAISLLDLNSMEAGLRTELRNTLLELVQKAGQAGALPSSLVAEMSFDLTNPEVFTFVRDGALNAALAIRKESEDAIRELIRRSFAEGIPTRDIARDMRDVLGLTDRQVVTLSNYRDYLEALAEKSMSGLSQAAMDKLSLGGMRGFKTVARTGLTEDRIDSLVETYSERLLSRRAEGVARTLTIEASNEGQNLLWRQAIDEGLLDPQEWEIQWSAADDERVCFPAGTQVETPKGSVAIETLCAGDVVQTHLGPRRVVACASQLTAKPLVAIEAAGRTVVATADHPFLALRNGWAMWIDAGLLKQGDLLCELESSPNSEPGPEQFYIRLGNSDDAPSLSFEPAGSALLSGLVAVPVDAVSFQGNAPLRNEKVDAVPAELGLSTKGYTEVRERGGNSFLKGRGPVLPAVAGEGTEAAVRIAWEHTKSDAARITWDEARRTPAEFRAKAAGATALTSEEFPAALAADVTGGREPAGFGADGIAVSNCLGNRKLFGADRTGFDNDGRPLVPEIAGPRAEGTRSLSLGASRESFSAPSANVFSGDQLGEVVAGLGAVPPRGGNITECFATSEALSHFCSLDAVHTVYSLEVEEARTFFAAGFLVHNCPICDELDGQTRSFDGDFPGGEGHPPAHPSCRCSEILVRR